MSCPERSTTAADVLNPFDLHSASVASAMPWPGQREVPLHHDALRRPCGRQEERRGGDQQTVRTGDKRICCHSLRQNAPCPASPGAARRCVTYTARRYTGAMKRAFVLLCGLAAAALSRRSPSRSRRCWKAFTTWTAYQGGQHSSDSALTQINRQTVSKLEVAWTFPSGNRNFMFGPLVADGLIYVLAGANDLVALNAATGAKVWSRSHPGAVGTRGINYWRSADGKDQRLLYMAGGHLKAVNAKTGETHPGLRRQRPRGPARRACASSGAAPGPHPAADEQPRPRLRGSVHHRPAGAGHGLRLQPR